MRTFLVELLLIAAILVIVHSIGSRHVPDDECSFSNIKIESCK